ncbi:hypothetical protein NDU88_008790 [Pleurodeles waltl]|uniref:Uncharacterized protein n=1 Tax=Pleurodeles waltl TaxID=8319 RepID=A0AAV7P4K0_PLEWA|nr:hypothetical protein NDU88_008790 [Pleurodeles waltl]
MAYRSQVDLSLCGTTQQRRRQETDALDDSSITNAGGSGRVEVSAADLFGLQSPRALRLARWGTDWRNVSMCAGTPRGGAEKVQRPWDACGEGRVTGGSRTRGESLQLKQLEDTAWGTVGCRPVGMPL